LNLSILAGREKDLATTFVETDMAMIPEPAAASDDKAASRSAFGELGPVTKERLRLHVAREHGL
jgi:hypothetical protein